MKTIALTIDEHIIITIPHFIASIKQARDNPETIFSRSIKNWYPMKGKDIIGEYHEIINKNINRRGNLIIRELKDYTGYLHAQRLLNNPRAIIRIFDLPKKLRKRFQERIYHGQD